jgi:MFS family permease
MNETPRKLPRSHLALLFSALVVSALGQTLIYAILPPVGRELGLSEIEVGLVITLSALTAFAFATVWGRLSDRFGRVAIIVLGLAGYSVFTLAFVGSIEAGLAGLVSTPLAYALMVGSRMVFGAIASSVGPAAQAYVADSTSAGERTAGMAVLGASYGVGTVLGPVMAAALVFLDLMAPLYAAAALGLISAVLIRATLPEPARHRHEVPQGAEPGLLPVVWPYALIAMLIAMTLSVGQQVAPFYLQDRFALDARETVQRVGIVMVCLALTSVFAQAFLVQRFRPSPRTLLRAGLPLLIAGFVALASVDSFAGFAAGFAILGLGFGLAIPGYTAAASLSVPPHRQGQASGLIASGLLLGFVIGPVLGTALFQLAPLLPFVVDTAICLVLGAFIWRIRIPAAADLVAQEPELQHPPG